MRRRSAGAVRCQHCRNDQSLEAARTFTHDNGIEEYRLNLSADVEECVIDAHYAVMVHYASVIIDW